MIENEEQRAAWMYKVSEEMQKCQNFVFIGYNGEGERTSVVSPMILSEAMEFLSSVFDKLNQGKYINKSSEGGDK